MAIIQSYKTNTFRKVEDLKRTLDNLPIISKVQNRILQNKFRLEFNYNSNHLEGNTLTYGQTELILKFDKSVGDVPLSDIEEMKAHDTAFTYIEEMAKDVERPLTESFILQLNEIILVKPFWKEAISADGIPTKKKIEIGKYKSTPNSVRLRDGSIHEYASPEETPSKMFDLMAWYAENLGVWNPVQLAAEFHYRFVCIHPFDDGNGRVSRLLMNYILLKFDYPPVIIKSKDKEAYLTALQKADVGDLKAIIEYVEKEMIWSLDLFLKATKGEDITDPDDLDKEIELLKRDKLTNRVVHKTPKVVFDLVLYYNETVWAALSKKLNKFSDFFSEIQDDIFFGTQKIGLEHKNWNILSNLGGNKITGSHEMFGIDLDKVEVGLVSWEKRFLGLQSATNTIGFTTKLVITLSQSKFKVHTSITPNTSKGNIFIPPNESIVTEDTREYKSYQLQSDIDTIGNELAKKLLNLIKNQ